MIVQRYGNAGEATPDFLLPSRASTERVPSVSCDAERRTAGTVYDGWPAHRAIKPGGRGRASEKEVEGVFSIHFARESPSRGSHGLSSISARSVGTDRFASGKVGDVGRTGDIDALSSRDVDGAPAPGGRQGQIYVAKSRRYLALLSALQAG